MFSTKFHNVFKCGNSISLFGFVWFIWVFLLINYLLISLLTSESQESKPEYRFSCIVLFKNTVICGKATLSLVFWSQM